MPLPNLLRYALAIGLAAACARGSTRSPGSEVQRERLAAAYDSSVARLVAYEVITPAGAAYFDHLADSLRLWQPFGKTGGREGPRVYLEGVDAVAPFLLGELGGVYWTELTRRSAEVSSTQDTAVYARIVALRETSEAQFGSGLAAVRWLHDSLARTGIAPGYARELGAILHGAADADTLPRPCRETYSWSGGARPSPAGIVPSHRTTFGTHGRKLVADVFAAGLLDTLSYRRTVATIDSCELFLEFSLLHYAAAQLRERNRYPEALAEQRAQLHDLMAAGLLSQTTVDSLLGTYGPRELKSDIALAGLLRGAYKVALHDYPADRPTEAVPQLVRDIVAAALPGLVLSDVSCEVVDTARWADEPGRLALTLDGQSVAGRFWLDRFPEPGELLNLDRSYVGVLNAALAERGDPRRIVLWEERDGHLARRSVVAALTEGELAATGSLAWRSNQPSFDTRFTRGNVEALIAEFDSLGLLVALSSADLREGTRCVMEKHVTAYGDVLACFPGVFKRMWWEGIGSDSAYALLLAELAEISRGGFRPTDISDDFVFGEDRPVTLAFTLDGERFSAQLDYRDDWYDPDAVGAVAGALVNRRARGGFYYVPADELGTYLVWLDDAQADWLRARRPGLVGEGSRVAPEQ